MKLFKKIALVAVGATMAVGAGISVAFNNASIASAASITKTTAALADEYAWVNGTAYLSWALDDVITISTTGTGNSGKYYSSNETWRLYQTGGGNLIITAAAGYELSSVNVSYLVSNTGTLVGLPSGTTVAVSGSSVSYSVGNTGTATNGQANPTSFTIEYAASGSPSVTVDSTPAGHIVIGDTGTLTALPMNATSPTYAWSSGSPSIVEINASTGFYEAKGAGSAEITVTMTCTEGTFTGKATIFVDYGLITIAQANTLCAALASGATSEYKITIEGYLTNLNPAARTAGSERDLTLSSVKVGETGDAILIYGVYNGTGSIRNYAILNGFVRYTGNLQNYSGTYELINPELVSYTDDAIGFATDSNLTLDPECSASSVLSTTWTALAADYAALDTYAQARLTAATAADTNNAEIADFIARYIIIVNKYGYSNFMGHALSAQITENITGSNNVYLVIIIAMSSFAVLGISLFLKKKKEVK